MKSAAPRERIEHPLARLNVPTKEDLDQLRDKLAQVRMKPVDMLRPKALRQFSLGPRQLRVEISFLQTLTELALGRHRSRPYPGASDVTLTHDQGAPVRSTIVESSEGGDRGRRWSGAAHTRTEASGDASAPRHRHPPRAPGRVTRKSRRQSVPRLPAARARLPAG